MIRPLEERERHGGISNRCLITKVDAFPVSGQVTRSCLGVRTTLDASGSLCYFWNQE
jgi:hypothetical protein